MIVSQTSLVKSSTARVAASAALLVFALGCGGSEKKDPPPPPKITPKANTVDIDSLYAEGRQYEVDCRFRDARDRFMQVKGIDPNYKDISARLEGYDTLASLEEDIEENFVSEPDESRSLYLVEFASALRARGLEYRDQARTQLARAIDLDANNFEAHYGLATLYLESSYHDQAITAFEKAASVGAGNRNRTSDAYYQLSFLYRVHRADPAKALENAKLAVDFSAGPALPKRRMYAELLMSAGQRDEAIVQAEKILTYESSTDGDKARVERFKAGKAQNAPVKPAEAPKPEEKAAEAPKPEEARPEEAKPEEARPEEKAAEAPKAEEAKPAEAPASQPTNSGS